MLHAHDILHESPPIELGTGIRVKLLHESEYFHKLVGMRIQDFTYNMRHRDDKGFAAVALGASLGTLAEVVATNPDVSGESEEWAARDARAVATRAVFLRVLSFRRIARGVRSSRATACAWRTRFRCRRRTASARC